MHITGRLRSAPRQGSAAAHNSQNTRTGSGACQSAPSAAAPSKPRSAQRATRSGAMPPSAITSVRRSAEVRRASRSATLRKSSVGRWPDLEIEGNTGLKNTASCRPSDASSEARSWQARLRNRPGGTDASGWPSLKCTPPQPNSAASAWCWWSTRRGRHGSGTRASQPASVSRDQPGLRTW